MKKILVPIDFSDVSENATKFAIDLAEKNGAEVTLFNSIHFDYSADYQFSSFSASKTLMDDIKDAVEEKMAKYVSFFDTDKITETIVRTSYMVTAIKELVAEKDFDLVVLGTSGCSGLEEVFIGSNTEKIVRNAPCPVIAVPETAKMKQIKSIMVPLDIREIKASFLQEMKRLQDMFGASFDFLWVKTPHNIENEEKVLSELSELINSFGIKNATLTIEKSVFPSDAILWHAQETNVDMLAMATHARRGLAHWFSGSLTEDTVNHIDIPVWTFKIEKSEKSISLDSVKNAHGKPDYKKIELLTID